ncbi:hypothetical protein ACQY1Q_11985 [Tenacibaculum sp. TC6]|uniref:hypothetical protein n=1 Tax=Tenacibaculum sp. TC6 TaxID=3423223 RepID=UPI003D36D341
MKKSILNLGKALSKVEQKQVKGGSYPDKESCKFACRELYGMYGVCIPDGNVWVCTHE